MRRVLLVAMLAGLVTASMAGGFSLGYKAVDLPVYFSGSGQPAYSPIYTLRFGSAVSPEFRMEGLLGYNKVNADVDGDNDISMSVFSIGGSGYYVLAQATNTTCSMGATLLYTTASSDYDGTDGPSTSHISIFPMLRVDFAFPSVERFAIFTEFGLRYVNGSTTEEVAGEDVDYNYSRLSTWHSPHILGGAYYQF